MYRIAEPVSKREQIKRLERRLAALPAAHCAIARVESELTALRAMPTPAGATVSARCRQGLAMVAGLVVAAVIGAWLVRFAG